MSETVNRNWKAEIIDLDLRVAKHDGVARVRPLLNSLQFLIIHHTATYRKLHDGSYAAIDMANYLTEQRDGRNVCVHLHIGENGRVTKWNNLIDFSSKKVYQGMHVSSSSYKLDNTRYVGLNKYTIGIECSGNCTLFPLAREQYKSLINVVKWLQVTFPVLNYTRRILRHTDVAPRLRPDDIGKKYFNWDRFIGHVNNYENFIMEYNNGRKF